jgi:hypothetical protein
MNLWLMVQKKNLYGKHEVGGQKSEGTCISDF